MWLQRLLYVIAMLGAIVSLAACGGDEEEASPTMPAGSPAAPAGGLSIAVSPAAVSAGEAFTVEVRGLPEDIVSGGREACVGVVDPTGTAEPIKLGRIAPGQADRTIEGVLPKDAKAGAYEVALAPCDFAPGSAIASAPLQVK